MKFRIYRSSIIWHGAPCGGAYKRSDDPSANDWCIDIETLDDLKNLQKSIGRHALIIDFEPFGRYEEDDTDGWIEIYDSYRE